MISVVIPAHNEAEVIVRCLTTLTSDAEPDELEVIVACNGCTDSTAALAEATSPLVRVVETPVASKIEALNLGDASASAFPRFYVDADVQVSHRDLEEVAAALDGRSTLAGAPRLQIDTTGAPWLVRAHLDVWSRLPYANDTLIGSGVYGVTRSGRDRFERFPDLIADDLFVRNLFDPSERVAPEGTKFVIDAPSSYRALVRRNIRVFAGNDEHRSRFGPEPDQGGSPGSATALASLVRANPRLLPHVAVYVTGTAISKIGARRRARRQEPIAWAAHR